MIVISLDYLVTLEKATANSPVIGYHNLVNSSNMTSTTENSLYPLSNVANPATHLEWRGLSDEDDEEIYFTTPVDYDDDIDYVAIARHNFGTAGITVKVEGYEATEPYSTLVGPVVPGDNSPLILRFTPGKYKQLRITLTPGSELPRASVIYVGKLLVAQRRIYVGHTPLRFGRQAVISNGRSTSGNFLGRVVLSEKNRTSVNLQNLTPAWYRSEFEPFVKASVERPFFFAWRPGGYPTEVGYCWLVADAIPVNSLPNGMMQVQMEIEGIVS